MSPCPQVTVHLPQHPKQTIWFKIKQNKQTNKQTKKIKKKLNFDCFFQAFKRDQPSHPLKHCKIVTNHGAKHTFQKPQYLSGTREKSTNKVEQKFRHHCQKWPPTCTQICQSISDETHTVEQWWNKFKGENKMFLFLSNS